MPEPRFDGIDAVIADVEETRRIWNTYKEYQTELSAIRAQDWITFRARIFELADFSAKWLDAVKGKTKDPVCVRVHDEAEDIRKAVPALKFARGEPFKEDHWSQARLSACVYVYVCVRVRVSFNS